MALLYSEEPAVLTPEEKGKARIKLFFMVLAIDTIAVAGCLYLMLVLGWDEMLSLIPVLVIAVITGFYYQWKKMKIER
jgi:hypothetical protein